MRFAGAKQQGLDEDLAALIDEGWQGTSLSERHKAGLAAADAFLDAPPRALSPEERAGLDAELGEAGTAELALSILLFRGLSEMLIVLGLEPEQMDLTVVPTPGSR